MDITHLGHSCVLLQVADQRVLVDPGTFSDFEAVRDLTAIVVTHQHPDHLDPARWAPLLTANPGARVLLEAQTATQLSDEAGGHLDRLETLTPGEDVSLGELTLTPVGLRHAFIHDYVPRIDNTGVVLRAPGEPSLFHPGDALDAEPGRVDVLLVPLNAPWARVGDTVEFARRLEPGRAVPIHDGLLNDTGRAMYLNHLRTFGAEGGLEVLDLAGAGATTL